MKTTTLALAASALLMGAEAGSVFRRNHGHAHRLERRGGYDAPEPEPEAETCKIVTYTTWKEYNPPKPTYATTEYVKSTVTVIPTPYTTVPATYTCPVPTPEITTCSTTGTYTFPAKTVTVTDTETVCVPTSTVLPPGCHTYGYTTTEVKEKTTVTCPYATTVTSGTAIYTTKTSTIFECPTPGTYTYGGHTTTLTKTETITYPTLTCYTPATYSHPATTVTVTETNYVFSCPYTVVTPPPAPKPEPPKETYAPPPPVDTYEAPPKEEKPAPPTYSAPPTKPPKGDPKKIGDGKQWAVIYTPFLETDAWPRHADCKSPERIDADLSEIKKYFRAVRIYAPDCGDTFKVLVDLCKKHDLKIIIGVFFHPGAPLSKTDEEVDRVISVLKSDWSCVEFVVIGNEAVWGGHIPSQTLVDKIIEYKPKFQSAGYTGYFTTSEVVSTLEANPGICSVVDIVAVNIQPYFNGGKSSDAGKFIHQQMEQASNVCGGKPTYCLEAGWPSAGAPIADAYATPNDQKLAINSIRAEDTGKICYFSPYNDLWKNPNMNGGVEQHFGCLNIFGEAY